MNEIALIEKEIEYDYIEALNKCERRIHEIKVIALNAIIIVCKETSGNKIATIEDYTDTKEINEIGIENNERLNKLIAYIDQKLSSLLFDTYGKAVTPGHYYEHYFKILLDAVGLRVLYLVNMLREEKPECVYYFETEKDSEIMKLFFVNESIFSRLTPVVCEFLGIRCEAIKLTKEKAEQPKGGIRKRRILESVRNRYSLSFLKAHPLRYVLSIINDLRNKRTKTLLMVKPLIYDTGYLVREFQKEGNYKIIDWYPEEPDASYCFFPPSGSIKVNLITKNSSDKLRNLWTSIKKEDYFEDIFKFEGINVIQIVENRLGYFFSAEVKKCVDAYLTTYEIIKKNDVDLMMLPVALQSEYRAAIHAARELKVPVITYQHGGVYGYCIMPHIDKMEMEGCDYYFSFGLGSINHFEKIQNGSPKICPIGSASLYNNFNMRKSEYSLKQKAQIIKNIMYIPTTSLDNQYYISNNNYPDIYYYRTQIKIVECLRRLKQYRVILKLPPATLRNESIKKYLSMNDSENFEISDIPLSRAIDDADAYILDHPATAFLQCLTTGKPVFIFIDRNFIKLTKEATRILDVDTGIIYSQVIDDFCTKLSNSLNNEVESYEEGNYEFISAYGLGSYPGGPTVEGIRLVEQIIHSQHRSKNETEKSH